MAVRKSTMTQEQRRKQSERMKAMNAAKKAATQGPAETAPEVHPRAMAEKSRRRRRTGMGYQARLKLTIPPHLERDPNYRYYWLADRPGRVDQLTKHDDYDFVTDEEAAGDDRQAGLGSRIERHAGIDQFGNPIRHFLVRKPIDYHREDQREKRAERQKTMAAIQRGKTADESGQPIHSEKDYVPEAGITIRHGDYKP